MLMELQRPNIGLAGFALSFSTLLTLEKNGTLADHEAIEIVNQALEMLRNHEPGDNLQSHEAWQWACELLEKLRTFLSSADYRNKHLNY
jgi:hypothetical protein